MQTVNIHEAKTHLSRLLEQLGKDGEAFVIAKAGKPIATVTPFVPEPKKKPQRIGALKGMFTVPDDFDTMFQDEIIAEFENSQIFPNEDGSAAIPAT